MKETIAEKIVEDVDSEFPDVEWLPKGYYELQKRSQQAGELVANSDWGKDVPSMFPTIVYLFDDKSALSLTEKDYTVYLVKDMFEFTNEMKKLGISKFKQETEENMPKTITEALHCLMTRLSDEDKIKMKTAKKEDLVMLHFGLGMYIRNEFGLSKGNKELLESCGSESMHPDDASSVIMKKLWETLQLVSDDELGYHRYQA